VGTSSQATRGCHPMYALTDRSESTWRWITALGLAVFVLSCAAAYSIGAASSASMSLLGTLMTLAAAAQVLQAFQVHSRTGFNSCLISGALYGVAGLLAITNPALTAKTLVLLLALTLVASGLVRAWWTLSRLPEPSWRSFASSGAVTALVGTVFAIGWPRDTIWVVGTLLAMDLAWQGLMTLAFGLALKQVKNQR
jgi:uncharacterized membrane protein HdeD (DUF308 family)